MRTRACAAAFLLALSPALFEAAPAYAQNDAMTEMARQRFQEGVKFFDGKKFEEARAAFLQAYALKHHPAVLLNLAQSELRSNHPADAARHFATYLRENTAATALEKQDAQKGLEEARTKCGHVNVVVNAAGADILVDDELVGKAPLPEPVDVSAGDHKVEARYAGHSASVTVTAAVGKTVDANLSVEGGGAPAVAAVPGAPMGATPAGGPPPEGAGAPMQPGFGTQPPPPGDTGVSFSTSHRQPFFPWFKSHPLAWAGAGLTVVGLGMGIGGSLAASSAGKQADDTTSKIESAKAGDPELVGVPMRGFCSAPPRTAKFPTNYVQACDSLRKSLDQQSSDKTIATIGFVTAGVAAVGTGVYYFFSSKRPADSAPPAAVLTPIYGPQFAGMSLSGAF